LEYQARLANNNIYVNINGKILRSFETVLGLRQGDALPTFFFNLCLGKIVRSLKTNPGTTFDTAKHCLLCASCVALLGHAVKHVAETAGDATRQM
jgi:hypothetical protein